MHVSVIIAKEETKGYLLVIFIHIDRRNGPLRWGELLTRYELCLACLRKFLKTDLEEYTFYQVTFETSLSAVEDKGDFVKCDNHAFDQILNVILQKFPGQVPCTPNLGA